MDCYDVNERTNDMPYGAEYAKSGRSSCKKCRGYIGEGYLRLSAREPSRFFDGVQDNWFHLDCFFHKLGRGAINERSIRGLENLRWEDQEKLRERIQEVDRGGSSSPTSNKRKPHYRQVKVQHSKSKRGKCSKCRESFNAKEVKFGVKSAWFHQKCSVDEEEYEGAVTDMQGFDELTDEAKEALKQSLGNKIIPQPDTMTTSAGPNAEEGPGRMPNESAAAHNTSAENLDSKDSDSDEEVPTIKKFCFTKPAAKPTETLKDKLKKQTDIMWGIREQFQQAKFGKQNMIELLRFNGQLNEVMEKKTEEQLLEHLVDCICFGKPVQCDRCDTGLLIFSITLRTYACIGYISEFTRCINVDPNPPRTIFMIPKSMDKRFPFLANVPFNALSQRVYPGENEDVVKRRDSSYFKNLGSRGATERYTESVKQGIDENGISKKIIKFGTAVDGEFHAAAECHVYKDEEGVLYSAALHMTDVLSNINSYYKMQLLKDDTQDIFYVFRSWGRVGTNVGGLSSDRYWSVQPAVNQFSEIFFEKTANKWENKKYFKKRPGRFGYVETDYTELENVKETTIIPGSTTKLHRSVKELILMISDVKNLNKQAANELQLDTTRMPLGKLSKQQITTAYTVLTDVQKLLADGAPVAAILDATNKFYTLIPHDFGMKNADILDNTDIIKKKCEMLDALIGFQFAYDFLRRGENEPDAELRDPVDITYGNLYCNMEYVDPQSIDYALIQKYLENSHGETHSHYKMSLIDVIKLKRSGEEEKFMRDLGNRKLLWHGSGIGNFVGILSKGLRIAPPEAPVSGYMFGKGIYFADMVSKSANYCRVDRGEGLLLLCDVALGNVKEEYHAGAKGPPKGYNSIKGVGRIRPVDDVYQHPDGYTIALNGQAKDADPNVPNANYSLIYNEYIVYTLDQCVLRYIVRVKFA